MRTLGFECQAAGENILSVTTPLSFIDGEVIGFYLSESNDRTILLSDNADTLAHLYGLGIPLDDRRRWRSFQDFAHQYNLTLDERGEVFTLCQKDDIPHAVARYFAFVHEVTEWEATHSLLPEDESVLVDEIEQQIRRRNPAVVVNRSPRVVGATGREYVFALQAGGTVIDPLLPNSRSTGAALRKVLDVERGPQRVYPLLVVEDRQEYNRARSEMLIVSAVARVIPMSELIHGAGPLDLAA